MKTICKTEGSQTWFIISDLDPVYQPVMLRNLHYTPLEEGFGKSYPVDTPHLDRIYQNFALAAEEIVLQTAGAHPVPWERALLAFLHIVEGQGINWWLVGSAALAARGIPVAPHDIDLAVDDATTLRLGELLLDYLVEPVQYCPGWICNWFGRAFLHTRLEWVGGVHADIDIPELSDFGPTAESRQEVVNWCGVELRVPPLDLQLEVSRRRGLTDRVAKIERFLGL